MNQICKMLAGTLLALMWVPVLASSTSAVPAGVKREIKGRISQRAADTIVVRDANDMDTVALLTDDTMIKSNKKA